MSFQPVAAAKTPAVIESIMRRADGMIPDGVELSGGRADTVTVSGLKDWRVAFRDGATSAKQAVEILGVQPEQPDAARVMPTAEKKVAADE